MRSIICLYILVLHLAFAPVVLHAQPTLSQHISKVTVTINGKVGVGVLGLDFKDSLVVNNNIHYPMQSVFKFPLAMAILHQIDKGQLSLTQKIHISKRQLDTATWSPLVKDFPNADIDITLSDLLIYTVSKSDNNGCDALFRLAGGTAAVNEYIHSLGVKDIAIKATEDEMKKAWSVQYTNWCTPAAMLQLLNIFYSGKALSAKSNEFLMKIMVSSENSPARLKGALPAGTVIAHKTGTSDADKNGMMAATNDVGIVTLPDGRHYAIVVYVSDYKGGTAKGEKTIATISKLVFDYYTARP